VIIRDLRARGTTVFLNSHLLSEVEQVCDRVAVIDHGRVIALGTMDELRGRQNVVRVRLGNVGSGLEVMRRFGEVTVEEDACTITGIAPDEVPGLVTELVRLGCPIYAVEPRSQSLEDRFLELLGGHDAAGAYHRTPDSA
jgi:ABC-2 type transport system ATP-binding protein